MSNPDATAHSVDLPAPLAPEQGAVLSMDRAIQIATSQVPGKVLACSLGRDGDKLFYHVVIISGDGDKSYDHLCLGQRD